MLITKLQTILVLKNVTAFCPFPKKLPEDKPFKNGLFSLVEEISRQSYADSVSWLLVILNCISQIFAYSHVEKYVDYFQIQQL